MSESFRTVLNMSISGSIVICAVLLGRLLLRRAPKKWSYCLWIAAAFRLCCPVSIRSAISLFRVMPGSVGSAAPGAGGSVGRLSYIPMAQVVPSAAALPTDPPAVSTTALPAVTAAPVTPGQVGAAASAAASPLETVMTVLCAIWLAGIAALTVYALVDYIRLRRLTALATKLEGERAVFRSELVLSPFILGFLRPRIYIPYTLGGTELDYVLAHEKAHLRRGDHIVKTFSFVLLALHWFNPFCWLAFLLMSRDMEMSCDEKVLAGGEINAEYSTTLLSLASAKRFPAPNPLCFGEGAVKERIKNAMKYKKPKLIITLTAAVLCLLIVAACVVNPTGQKPEPNGGEPAETTPEPTAETPTAKPTEAPTAEPTARPSETKGIFTNSLGESIDKLYICLHGHLLENLVNYTAEERQMVFAEELAAGEGASFAEHVVPSLDLENAFFDIGLAVGERLIVLHDAPLDARCSVEVTGADGGAEFTVTSADGSETHYPAEIYGGDPFTVPARDENLLELEAVEYYCSIYQDSSRTEGYRVDWTDFPTQYDFNDKSMIAVVRFVLVELSAADAARFPALASALEANNTALRTATANRLGEAGKAADRVGCAEYNLASYVRRADTRVLSVLYQIWCGNQEAYHTEPADMSERRYESATFDTQTGELLGPNDAAEGIDGGEKYSPHENYAWTYDHDGVSFFINSLETPCCGEFVSIADNPSLFNEKYLPVTENYIVTLSVVPGDGLTVLNIGGSDDQLRFAAEHDSGYSPDGSSWAESSFTVEGNDYHYTIETGWDRIHIDRILFVHANGRDYLYTLQDTPNSYRTAIFGISNGRFYLAACCESLSRLPAADTDPMNLASFAAPVVLGSHAAAFRCAVNCYGIPMRTGWFELHEVHTLLRELEVSVINEDGTDSGESVVLEPGQTISFIRTDGQTIVDMLLPNGRMGRVETDGTWTGSIDGVAASLIFDNIYYGD